MHSDSGRLLHARVFAFQITGCKQQLKFSGNCIVNTFQLITCVFVVVVQNLICTEYGVCNMTLLLLLSLLLLLMLLLLNFVASLNVVAASVRPLCGMQFVYCTTTTSFDCYELWWKFAASTNNYAWMYGNKDMYVRSCLAYIS